MALFFLVKVLYGMQAINILSNRQCGNNKYILKKQLS